MAGVDVIRVVGGARLSGEVAVAGAKNSALELMAVALLATGQSVISNVPRITDILIMSEVLRRLDCQVSFDHSGSGSSAGGPGTVVEGGEVRVDTPDKPGTEADYDLVRRLRASICVLGPPLAPCGYVRVAHPGGDAIGSLGPGMHVGGAARMGAGISAEPRLVIASGPEGLPGAAIWLVFPAVRP